MRFLRLFAVQLVVVAAMISREPIMRAWRESHETESDRIKREVEAKISRMTLAEKRARLAEIEKKLAGAQ